MRAILKPLILIAAFFAALAFAQSDKESQWGYRTLKKKKSAVAKEEVQYTRKRVDIISRLKSEKVPTIQDADAGFIRAREYLKEKKNLKYLIVT